MGIFRQFPYSNFHDMNMDEIIKLCRELADDWVKTKADWAALYSDINSTLNDFKEYIETLDLQDEVNVAINRLIANGTMQEILASVASDLQQQIQALSARVDAFEQLPEGSTSGDAELIDIRNGFDGFAYNTAGAAVRGEDDIINYRVTRLVDARNLLITSHYVSSHYYSGGEYASSTYMYFIVPVVSGTKYVIPRGLRFLSKVDAQIYNHPDQNLPYTYEADFTGMLYVTFYQTMANLQMYTEGNASVVDEIGSFQDPTLHYRLLSQIFAYDKKKAIAADVVTKERAYSYGVLDTRNILVQSAPQINKYFWSGTAYDNTSYTYYKVSVTNGVEYFIPCGARFIAKAEENIYNDSSLLAHRFTADFTGDLYITFDKSFPHIFCKMSDFRTMVGSLAQNRLSDVVSKRNKAYQTARQATLNVGESLYLTGTNIKKNNRYYFNGQIAAFTRILMGHGVNTYSGSWIEVTATQLISHYYFSEDVASAVPHGLTISDELELSIVVKNDNTAVVTITSGGSSFSRSVPWHGDCTGDYFFTSNNARFLNATFTWSAEDLNKKTWLMGDSYVTINDPARWAYYLNENNDIDKILISGFGGESGNQGITCMSALINSYYSYPDTIIWAYGMNDQSDGANAPSAQWMNAMSEYLRRCGIFGIEPILCTIPTVPTINHEQKNAWIRNSGFRYIDFAKAVGATATGVWYDGMLSADGIHPTAKGAKALYTQAMVDAPELTFNR